jgi:hypothetical protein
MSTADEGRRRAEQYLSLVASGEQDAADALLAGTTELADMTYLGAAFTAISRSGARTLSPAHRAQATGRHMRIAALRDAGRVAAHGGTTAPRDPAELRPWLAALAGEAVFVRGLLDVAAERAAAAGADGAPAGPDGPVSPAG